jgi:hypothetical protein
MATAAMAIAAHTGWLPVANATTVRARARPAAIPATRREILDGPVEPAAAIEAAANAERSVALMCGSVEPSANPATRPHTM